jgi:hypothetical protein
VKSASENFQQRLETMLADNSGASHDLPGLNFDQSGSLATGADGILSSLAKAINNNPSLKARLTVYGKTEQEAASRANLVREALVKAGAPEDRIAIQTDIGQTVPKISFTK